jgi:asparagine synthase (glutamine-hydrolysing)
MAVKPEIMLKRHQWAATGQVYTAGFIISGGKLISAGFLAYDVKQEAGNFTQFVQYCSTVNGQFSVVLTNEEETWIHTGNTWSYPLYYFIDNQYIRISDSPETLIRETSEDGFSDAHKAYFMAFGVTPGSTTLLKNIRVMRPGESLSIHHGTHKITSSRQEIPESRMKKTETQTLAGLIRRRFASWMEHFGDRKILLPLTGGYDSRLLACLLKESGFTRVITATWGREGNSDGMRASVVAARLGFRHLFIPYTNHLIGNFPEDEQFLDYASYAGHYTSMPFLQDYFAIRELIKTGEIDKETIVIPGHPGDFIRGSHHYQGLQTATQIQIAQHIMMQFSNSLPLDKTNTQEVQLQISEQLFDKRLSGRQNFDRWDFEERQCKLIANSSAVYSYFGLQCVTPLFDKELTGFMLSLPFRERLSGRLYFDTLEKEFFRKFEVQYGTQRYPEADFAWHGWKNRLIRMIPHQIKKWYYPVDDPIFYHEITKKLRKSFKNMTFRDPAKPHLYNAYLVQWYHQWIQTRHIKPDSA